MSGHSKWSTIKRKKGVADAKRGAMFTKLGKLITVAARDGGGEPDSNFSLRLAIDKAKASNMPKDNIERSIARGTGANKEGTAIEEITYEAYAPGGVAMIIKTLTDNRNRTASEIKHLLSQHGGSLGAPGSVAWQFKEKGVVLISPPYEGGDKEGVELMAIEAGADDFTEEDEGIVIHTSKDNFMSTKKALEDAGVELDSAEIEYVADNEIEVNEKDQEKIDKLCDELDDNDDVSGFWHNAKL